MQTVQNFGLGIKVKIRFADAMASLSEQIQNVTSKLNTSGAAAAQNWGEIPRRTQAHVLEYAEVAQGRVLDHARRTFQAQTQDVIGYMSAALSSAFPIPQGIPAMTSLLALDEGLAMLLGSTGGSQYNDVKNIRPWLEAMVDRFYVRSFVKYQAGLRAGGLPEGNPLWDAANNVGRESIKAAAISEFYPLRNTILSGATLRFGGTTFYSSARPGPTQASEAAARRLANNWAFRRHLGRVIDGFEPLGKATARELLAELGESPGLPTAPTPEPEDAMPDYRPENLSVRILPGGVLGRVQQFPRKVTIQFTWTSRTNDTFRARDKRVTAPSTSPSGDRRREIFAYYRIGRGPAAGRQVSHQRLVEFNNLPNGLYVVHAGPVLNRTNYEYARGELTVPLYVAPAAVRPPVDQQDPERRRVVPDERQPPAPRPMMAGLPWWAIPAGLGAAFLLRK
jgi:hypothetical protein